MAAKNKASDKQAVAKKLMVLLKKEYKGPVPRHDRPVLETMLYGTCLENITVPQADAAFERLFSTFHDLNEVRVSSIAELEQVFAGLPDADWRAYRLRGVLQHVFEKNFNYEFEGLRKKTLDLAAKQLAKVRSVTPFVRNHTLHYSLGAHVLPVDDAMARAIIWLGLAEPGQSLDEISDSLKPAVRKPDAPLFCHLVRSLATDERLRDAFADAQTADPEAAEEYDLQHAPQRLTELLQHGSKGTRKAKSTAAKRNGEAAGSEKKAPKAAKPAAKKAVAKASAPAAKSKSAKAKSGSAK